jgi:nucleoside-diphosphate-sugar epimerase
MKVLVVGAGGFVGRRIVTTLSAKGIAVVAGVRASRADFAAQGIEQRLFDAADATATAGALDGITHVVNCVMGNAETMVAATRTLAEGSAKVGVTRLVHFSSIAVFGDASGLVTEAASFSPDVDAYGKAKIECERIVATSRAGGLQTVILRPGLIYGPGSEQWTGRIGRLLRWSRLGDLGAAGDGLCNLVFINDVVAAAVAALTHENADGQAFHLAPADPPTWNRFLMDFAREIDAVPVHRLPGWQLKLEKLAAIPLKLAEIARDRLKIGFLPVPDPVTPGLMRLFSQEVRYRALGTPAPLGITEAAYRDGLKAAAVWFLKAR